jgi:hypothetical protein
MLMPLLDRHIGMIIARRFLVWAPMNPRQPVIREQQLNRPVDGRAANWPAFTTQILIQLLGAKGLRIAHNSL